MLCSCWRTFERFCVRHIIYDERPAITGIRIYIPQVSEGIVERLKPKKSPSKDLIRGMDAKSGVIAVLLLIASISAS